MNPLKSAVYVGVFSMGLSIAGSAQSVSSSIDLQLNVMNVAEDPAMANNVAVDESANRIYVVSHFDVVVIDGTANTVVTWVSLPTWPDPLVGTNRFVPNGFVAVDSSTHTIYLPGIDYTGNSFMAVLDGGSYQFTLIPMPTWADPAVGTNHFSPNGVAVDPIANRVYTVGTTDTGGYGLATLDAASSTFSVLALPTWSDPHVGTNRFGPFGNVAVNTSTRSVFVPGGDDTGRLYMAVIDTATSSTTLIPMPTWADPAVGTNHFSPRGVAVNSITNRIYTTGLDDTGQFHFSTLDGSTNTISLTPLPTWADPAVGTNRFWPTGLAVNPVTNSLYIPGFEDTGRHHIAVVNGVTNAVAITLDDVGSERGIAINSATNRIYAITGSRFLSVIDMPSNTTTGSNVAIMPTATLPNGTTTTLSLTFDNVSSGGNTSVTASSTGPPPPAGFKLTQPPVYYEITTTAQFTGNVRVCLNWTEGQIANENHVDLFHYEGGHWIDITDPTSRNTLNNSVCGTASSLSPFTLFEIQHSFTGFLQPVDNPPVFNKVKAGASIPVKFSLGANRGLNIFGAGYPRVALIQCDGGAASDDIEQTVTAGSSSLSYDTVANQYVYVWKTDKAWAGSCRQLQLGLDDGEIYTAKFNLTK